MRKSVTKKLKRAMAGTPKMEHRINGYTEMWVNHYRNAKKFYKGSVEQAVQDAENYAITNQAIGKYF